MPSKWRGGRCTPDPQGWQALAPIPGSHGHTVPGKGRAEIAGMRVAITAVHRTGPPFLSFRGVIPVSPGTSWEEGPSRHLSHSGGSSRFWLQALLTYGHWGALKALHFCGSGVLVRVSVPHGGLAALWSLALPGP